MPETTDQYHRLPVSEGHANHKICTITLSSGKGIKALYCVSCGEIVTYLFDIGKWTAEEAQDWVDKNKNVKAEATDAMETEKAFNLLQSSHEALASAVSALAGLIGAHKPGGGEEGDAAEDAALEQEPTAVTPTDSPLVASQDNPADDAPSQWQSDPVIQRMAAAMQNKPFVLYLETRADGPIVNEKGWIRKPILVTGEWVDPPPGGSEPLILTREHLELIKLAFDEGAFEMVPIPIGHGPFFSESEHVTMNNSGWVRALEIEQRPDGRHQLVGWFEFTESEIEKKIRNGSIWNCSVLVEPNVRRPKDGKTFPMALKHVALTNYPWMSELEGFIPDRIQAERLTTFRLGDTEIMERSELELKLEEQGLSLEDVLALARERDQLQALAKELAERERRLALERREADIAAIRLALEGRGDHQDVRTYKGTAHYPVVVNAVDRALKALPAGDALRLEGGAQAPNLDRLILDVVNAIPEEGRFRLEQPTVPPVPDQDNPVTLEDMTPEQKIAAADALAEALGL